MSLHVMFAAPGTAVYQALHEGDQKDPYLGQSSLQPILCSALMNRWTVELGS